LADWTQLTAYYQRLASESDRVRYAEIGKTTEGRPFVLTISAPENLAHLAHYLDIQRRLADPRITPPDVDNCTAERAQVTGAQLLRVLNPLALERNGVSFVIGASIGIAMIHTHTASPEDGSRRPTRPAIAPSRRVAGCSSSTAAR
jgi:hypothetical protein